MSRNTQDAPTHEQLIAGYTDRGDCYGCLHCDASVLKGRIYPLGADLGDAALAVQTHVADVHGSAFDALMATGKTGSGLSDTQRTLLGHFHDGLSDREIQERIGGVSLSTIRNHRFALREKARQARVFLALMALLESGRQDPGSRFIDIPGKGRADDERFAITRSEFDKIIRAHFPDGPQGPISGLPKKQKHKVAVLIQILGRFDPQRRYTQIEVNEILDTASEDHATLRRYLIDYGFLGRTRDGSTYWVE